MNSPPAPTALSSLPKGGRGDWNEEPFLEMQMAKGVYIVSVEDIWTYGSNGGEDLNVVATSVEDAIRKVKAKYKLGEKSQAEDDDEKPIKGKFHERRRIVIDAVWREHDIDL